MDKNNESFIEAGHAACQRKRIKEEAKKNLKTYLNMKLVNGTRLFGNTIR